jgi:hypothetical protein
MALKYTVSGSLRTKPRLTLLYTRNQLLRKQLNIPHKATTAPGPTEGKECAERSEKASQDRETGNLRAAKKAPAFHGGGKKEGRGNKTLENGRRLCPVMPGSVYG